MKFKYLIYFCDDIGSVFDSQVITLLKAISETNKFEKVYLFLGIRSEKVKNNLVYNKVPSTVETIFFKSFANYPFFAFMNRRSLKTALENLRFNLDDVLFHTRGEMIAFYLNRVSKNQHSKNILVDVRGTSIEEIEEFTQFNKLLKSFKIVNNKWAVRNLNKFRQISVVSESLKDYLATNYKIDPKRIFITPSLAGKNFRFNEAERSRLRRELNLMSNDKLIVFSSGGTANWQNNEVILKLAEKGLKVLNLSKKEISHKNVINRFVSYDEMPAYLNAADAAIIWRNKSIVNKVASPVKFSEYVCAGLPVIANHSVEMISEYISKHECGILVDNLESIDINTINTVCSMNRKRISEDGIDNFGMETIIEQYMQIYSLMNN